MSNNEQWIFHCVIESEIYKNAVKVDQIIKIAYKNDRDPFFFLNYDRHLSKFGIFFLLCQQILIIWPIIFTRLWQDFCKPQICRQNEVSIIKDRTTYLCVQNRCVSQTTLLKNHNNCTIHRGGAIAHPLHIT